MIKKEQEMIERLLDMAMVHEDMVSDNLQMGEYETAACHASDLKQVLYVLLDYVQHFTDNIGFELKDLSKELINNYDDETIAHEIGQKLNCLANGNKYIG